MTKRYLYFFLISCFLFVGCGGKKIKIDPNDPFLKAKNDFIDRFGFFITNEEKKKGYPDLPEPIGSFNKIVTLAELDKFTQHFLKIRDFDPRTPQNEFEELINKRVDDIRSEIFASDIDIPGTIFSKNRGLRGELAQVYLLYGMPHRKDKLVETNAHVELIVWYYFDVKNKPIFKFLFYQDGGRFRLFKKHIPMPSLEGLVDPLTSPLKDISNRMANTSEELYEIWQELEREDPEWIFRSALLQFSYYDDVNIHDSLKAPEPVSITALRFKPVILGQPGDLTGRTFINNRFNSFIPAKFRISGNDRPSFFLSTAYSDIDWEIKDGKAQLSLSVRISFQNKKTHDIKEFVVVINTSKTVKEVEEKVKGLEVQSQSNGIVTAEILKVTMEIPLDNVQNFASTAKSGTTLKDLILSLEPGEYMVNTDLWHPVTKKSASGMRKEIIIK